MGGYAWVTLATNDAYSLGALVLAHSLRRVGTKHELAVLVTPGVTQTMREKLSAVFSVVTEVNVLDSKDEANLALLARPELGITFTKLHCWRLTQYEKCVFLDADTLVVRNCDELFEREELSAAPDVGWPDCFNSGVFVYKPSQQTFASITAFAANKGSFDGGDQGLLNTYFSDWAHKDISKHLPFIYNMCSTATYSYLPAFKQFGEDVRIIHFIGITKPWLQYFDTLTGIVQPPMGSAHLQPLLQLWWNIFCEKVHPQLSPVMATSTLAPIWHEFSPMPFQSPVPNSPVYTDTQDKTQNDIYLKAPDFSEFKDPWENYCVQNDPVINKREDNETEQYYSTIDRSSPIIMSHNEFNCVKSAHQTHYEPPLEHNRESFHKQHYNEYNSSSSHSQQHYNQEQSNQFINENKQQDSFFHPENTSNTNVQTNYWQNERSVESYVPVHSTQNGYSTESQQQHKHVDYQQTYQHSCNDGNKLEETKQYQHVDHQPTYQYSYNDNNKSFPESTREHHHVQYQHAYQDSSNNNNNKPSEETKQYQHNEHYVNYQHSQHHTHDYTNNKQDTQYHEQKNQIIHHNEQREFVCKQHESFDVKVHHEQVTQNNVAHQNDFSVKINTEQRKNVNITDEQTNTLMSTSPHPVSKPCTDIHNVATQSDPHITEDSSNAGLAGALAQMTLGEPRSAEQIALEEHMRKQSWEQGQIDYMGRDSFDNIWKKICQTLALAPPRLPSPPKEIEKSEEATTDKTAESVESAELGESTSPAGSVDEVDKEAAQATASHTEEQNLVTNVPITSNDNVESKLSEKSEPGIDISTEANESKETVSEEITKDISQESLTRLESELDNTIGGLSSTALVEASEEIIEEINTCSLLKKAPQETTEKVVEEAPQETTVPIVSSDLVQPCLIEEQKDELSCNKDNASFVVLTQELASSAIDTTNLDLAVEVQQIEETEIRDEKHAKELSTASEVFTTSPVPIQVAESVLQVEPKESVSGSQAITEEVLSSTITPVHESNASCSEILTEMKGEVQMNGSASTIDSAQDKEKLSSDTTQNTESIDGDKLGESSVQLTETLQVSSPVEQPHLSETPTLLTSITKSVETLETSIGQSLQQTEQETKQEIEQVEEQTKKAESCIKETKEVAEPSLECVVSQTLPSTESPVRPSRAKELNVPSTNIPETPPEEQKSPEKVTKKVASKSVEKLTSEGELGETPEGDSTGKKVVKKVVKKGTKKPKSKPEEALDDGAQDSSSVSKPKKTVKVVKKGTKSSQTPDTDTTVPETPSSSTSDVPVPPKRKSKTTPTKPSVKKSDVE